MHDMSKNSESSAIWISVSSASSLNYSPAVAIHFSVCNGPKALQIIAKSLRKMDLPLVKVRELRHINVRSISKSPCQVAPCLHSRIIIFIWCCEFNLYIFDKQSTLYIPQGRTLQHPR